MEIKRTKIIEGKNAVELAKLFSKAMIELADKQPTFDKLSDNKMLIRYVDVEDETPTAKVIVIEKAEYKGPKCKDCPHYSSNEGIRRGEQTKWGSCGCLMGAARNGDKPICSIRIKETDELRKEVQVAEKQQHDYKTSATL